MSKFKNFFTAKKNYRTNVIECKNSLFLQFNLVHEIIYCHSKL